jgi:hypothetical protein
MHQSYPMQIRVSTQSLVFCYPGMFIYHTQPLLTPCDVLGSPNTRLQSGQTHMSTSAIYYVQQGKQAFINQTNT